ncbi:hypothetical protein ACN9OQ_12045, partial [Glaesserella parasuis]|uniref:hypothetical protein n=1 Tax=Glaesserella parasuis TaxID=738 RepID=UPI003B67B404
ELIIIALDSGQCPALGKFDVLRRCRKSLPRKLKSSSQIVEGKVSHYEIAAECGVFWTHNAFRGARRVPLFAQNAGSRNHLVALVRPQHMTALHHLV